MSQPLAIQLSPEEYAAKELLAQIGQEIARGRAELTQIRNDRTTYLEEREKEATTLVEAVLTASRTALAEAEKNRDQLASYHRELMAFRAELEEWQRSLAEEESDFSERKEASEAETRRRTEELQTLAADLRVHRELIASDRQSIAAAKSNIEKAKQVLGSERKALQVAWDELHNKQNGRSS
jgi:chromosome segregation ATPase